MVANGDKIDCYENSLFRRTIHFDDFIKALSNAYAPIYFDVFKLNNNFSQNINKMILKDAYVPQKNSKHTLKRRKATTMRD